MRGTSASRRRSTVLCDIGVHFLRRKVQGGWRLDRAAQDAGRPTGAQRTSMQSSAEATSVSILSPKRPSSRQPCGRGCVATPVNTCWLRGSNATTKIPIRISYPSGAMARDGRRTLGYVIVRFHVVPWRNLPFRTSAPTSLRYPQHEFVAVAPGLRSDGPGEGVVGGVEGAVTEVSATTLAHR